MGERHFQPALAEYLEHYHSERNHHGLDNRLVADTPTTDRTGAERRRPRLGGVLSQNSGRALRSAVSGILRLIVAVSRALAGSSSDLAVTDPRPIFVCLSF
jgi:hypothetical protein